MPASRTDITTFEASSAISVDRRYGCCEFSRHILRCPVPFWNQPCFDQYDGCSRTGMATLPPPPTPPGPPKRTCGASSAMSMDRRYGGCAGMATAPCMRSSSASSPSSISWASICLDLRLCRRGRVSSHQSAGGGCSEPPVSVECRGTVCAWEGRSRCLTELLLPRDWSES